MSKDSRGFTIVELLIVIVVIATLAAITIVAFNGIQQRAKTTAKVGTVQQAVKLILLYKADGTYPRASAGGDFCLTVDNACTAYNGTVNAASNTGLMDDLGQWGTPPASSGDATTDSRYGITYSYQSERTLQDISNPVLIIFFLDGTNQMCAGTISGMVSVADDISNPGNFVPANRSSQNSGGKTRCYMMFPN